MGIIEQDYSSKCEKDTGKMLRTHATVTTKQKGGISIEWQPPASNSLCFRGAQVMGPCMGVMRLGPWARRKAGAGTLYGDSLVNRMIDRHD